ncbi:hypothetical protein CLOM_g12281 [Closterium sp. NIES-68]|nr:hypothetical protein CLOM_g12281 [Closterium sp. NIES-68]
MAYPSASLSNPITPLRLDPNGSSPNFKEWSYGVDKHLLSRKIEGICLKDVLLNRGKGKMPILPKKLSATATGEELKTHEESMSKYEESYSVWEQADAAIIGVFVGTTPSELVKTYHNYPSAHAIWEYLNDRFLNKTAVGVAILIPRMFQVRLEECPGMADYVAEIQGIHQELKQLGIVFPEQAPAAALLVGLTPSYNVTRSMLLHLPPEELTFAKVSSALLSAEKDNTAQARANALRAPVPAPASRPNPPPTRNRYPPCPYVIKMGPRAGQVCGGTNHPLATCFKKKDDDWFAKNGINSKPPNWLRMRQLNQVEAQDSQDSAVHAPSPDVRLNLLFPGLPMINETSSHPPRQRVFQTIPSTHSSSGR